MSPTSCAETGRSTRTNSGLTTGFRIEDRPWPSRPVLRAVGPARCRRAVPHLAKNGVARWLLGSDSHGCTTTRSGIGQGSLGGSRRQGRARRHRSEPGLRPRGWRRQRVYHRAAATRARRSARSSWMFPWPILA
jgi:hypothetical protein